MNEIRKSSISFTQSICNGQIGTSERGVYMSKLGVLIGVSGWVSSRLLSMRYSLRFMDFHHLPARYLHHHTCPGPSDFGICEIIK